jgi:hypothetical protein
MPVVNVYVGIILYPIKMHRYFYTQFYIQNIMPATSLDPLWAKFREETHQSTMYKTRIKIALG